MVEIIRELNEATLKKIVRIIDDGGVIAFPTETVYAIAADASNHEAVEKIYEFKKRINSKPLPVLVGDIYQAKRICEFDERAKKIALHFFPGPITMVLKKKPHHNLAVNINSNIDTVGVRMPNHIIALKILQAVGRPLVGTSANISDQASSTNAYNVIKYFPDNLDLVFDQGETEIGTPSTIIDLSAEEIKILREGSIKIQTIVDVLSSS